MVTWNHSQWQLIEYIATEDSGMESLLSRVITGMHRVVYGYLESQLMETYCVATGVRYGITVMTT